MFQALLDFLASKGYPKENYKVIASWPRRDVSSDKNINKHLNEIFIFAKDTKRWLSLVNKIPYILTDWINIDDVLMHTLLCFLYRYQHKVMIYVAIFHPNTKWLLLLFGIQNILNSRISKIYTYDRKTYFWPWWYLILRPQSQLVIVMWFFIVYFISRKQSSIYQ